MKEIPLNQGKIALVDDEDYEAVRSRLWKAVRKRHTCYASRKIHRDGAWVVELMHRVVLARALGRPLAKGELVQHISGDALDNRRANLRLATPSELQRGKRHGWARRRPAPNISSQYLGVSWHKRNAKWLAKIQVNRKQIHLGCYATELDAAHAREAYISLHPELQAKSNFPS